MKTNDGKLYIVSGRSRSGKTAWTRKMVAKSRRVWAWDPEAQWCELPGWVKVTRRDQLAELMLKPGPQKVAYVAGGDLKKEFEFWADCVFYAGRYVAPLDAIGEELADVTTPAKAPGSWGILIRRGLKRGINLFCISQRWAEADKTAFGNASAYVMFAQSSGDDVRYLARKTRVPEAEIDALQPLEFVHFDVHTGGIKRDKLRF